MALSSGFAEGERVAKASFLTLVFIGIVEISVGILSKSVSLTADGADSIVDATISLIIWAGLRYSRKQPDQSFHFGYLKVESYSALIASIGMVIVASSFAYYSYLRLVSPIQLQHIEVALITLLSAGIISIIRAIQMNKVARRFNLLSLRIGALNSIKDGSASFIAFASVFIAGTGLLYFDAIGGLIIAGYIYSVAYISIKESSLVLLDACHRPELVELIKNIIEDRYPVEVMNVRLRRAGPYLIGIIVLLADGNLTLNQLDEFRKKIRLELDKHISGLKSFSLIFHAKKSRAMHEIREDF